jgi:ABC-type multidrug transport system fused ATPase/permease subunit
VSESLICRNYFICHILLPQQTMIDALTEEGDKPQTMIGDIEFDNVIFTYPSRQESPV